MSISLLSKWSARAHSFYKEKAMVILLLTATCCLMCVALVVLAFWLNHLENKIDDWHDEVTEKRERWDFR